MREFFIYTSILQIKSEFGIISNSAKSSIYSARKLNLVNLKTASLKERGCALLSYILITAGQFDRFNSLAVYFQSINETIFKASSSDKSETKFF